MLAVCSRAESEEGSQFGNVSAAVCGAPDEAQAGAVKGSPSLMKRPQLDSVMTRPPAAGGRGAVRGKRPKWPSPSTCRAWPLLLAWPERQPLGRALVAQTGIVMVVIVKIQQTDWFINYPSREILSWFHVFKTS